jgi:hypothetical protein
MVIVAAAMEMEYVILEGREKSIKGFMTTSLKYRILYRYRKLNYLSQASKNCLILYTHNTDFFLFEFQGARYIIRDNVESDFFVY